MSSALIPVVAVVGPTASGKTEAGLQIARERGGEIVSVDSRQVYRDLSIGTARPVGQWKNDTYLVEGISYHLVDFLDPTYPFSATAFLDRATPLIQEIHQRGRLPVLVGGTGLYYKALFEGLAPLPSADPALREELQAKAKTIGRPALHAELARVDPAAANAIPANNIQRVVRALEVFLLTGKPITSFHREHQASQQKLYSAEIVGIDPGEPELQKRIVYRASWMLEHGMIEETKAILAKGIAPTSPGLTGLGYPRVVDFLSQRMNRDQLLAQLVLDTRQYAKRQRTWFRNQMKVTWKTSYR